MKKTNQEKNGATKSRYTKSQRSGYFIQKKIFQAMAPAQKLEMALRLYYSARDLKAAGLRAQHPDWTEDQIEAKVREIFLYAQT